MGLCNMMLSSVLLLLVVSSIPSTVSAEKSFLDEIRDMEILKIRDGSSACPLPIVGQQCPESNALYLFKCCGDVNANCCFRLQDWAVAIIALFVIMIVVGIFVNLFRCIFCY
uniref:Uncharacterized protein n=1 Tax=Ditylenchus dipsaci TaxID=166011 RepID=A0A915DJZ2_9BILA